jgi:hypothetical protein
MLMAALRVPGEDDPQKRNKDAKLFPVFPISPILPPPANDVDRVLKGGGGR